MVCVRGRVGFLGLGLGLIVFFRSSGFVLCGLEIIRVCVILFYIYLFVGIIWEFFKILRLDCILDSGDRMFGGSGWGGVRVFCV